MIDMKQYDKRFIKRLYSADEIELGVKLLADRVAWKVPLDGLVIIPIMTGALPFAADFIRYWPAGSTAEVRPLRVSSYGRHTSPGAIQLNMSELGDLRKFTSALLLDDVYDTGATLDKVKQYLPGIMDVWTAVAFCRQSASGVNFSALPVPDDTWLVGYGLDLEGRYRHLPDLWAVEKG